MSEKRKVHTAQTSLISMTMDAETNKIIDLSIDLMAMGDPELLRLHLGQVLHAIITQAVHSRIERYFPGMPKRSVFIRELFNAMPRGE